MSEKATRNAYGEALVELAAKNDKIVVLDADLAHATMTVTFQKEYPNRHFNAGIAEANMVNMAAGMSTMGLIPFCSTFAMFGAGRAYEQIRNTIAYPRLNVKIACTHAGVSVGEDGGSHRHLPCRCQRGTQGCYRRRRDGRPRLPASGSSGHPGL